MDTAIIIELAKEYAGKVSEALYYLPYIHSGYLTIVLEETNGRSNPKD
jgi:hypothetical protein